MNLKIVSATSEHLFHNFFKKWYGVPKRLYSLKDNLSEREFGVYKIVKPAFVSERLSVPSHILKPPYVNSSLVYPDKHPKEPEIKTMEEIYEMRKSCSIASFILNSVAKHVKAGISTDELDKIAHSLCINHNVYPSPLCYMNFPKSICTSINNVACHGIPDDRPLEDGDIINIDVTIYFNGFHGDCSATYIVGNTDPAGEYLVQSTQQCLDAAIDICRPGEYFCSIGQTISDRASALGLRVVPCFAGHGIGRYFHGPPDIYHCYNDYPGKMAAGMTFTIEPVLTQGEQDVVVLEDGWTAVTADNARTAQFEHTVLVTGTGVEVLTEPQSSNNQ